MAYNGDFFRYYIGNYWYEVWRLLYEICRNTIPKWSNIDHKWANTPLGGASRRRGVCLVIKGLYLITSGLYFVEISTNFVPQSSNFVPTSSQLRPNFVPLRPNIWDENDVKGPHDIPYNRAPLHVALPPKCTTEDVGMLVIALSHIVTICRHVRLHRHRANIRIWQDGRIRFRSHL